VLNSVGYFDQEWLRKAGEIVKSMRGDLDGTIIAVPKGHKRRIKKQFGVSRILSLVIWLESTLSVTHTPFLFAREPGDFVILGPSPCSPSESRLSYLNRVHRSRRGC